MTNSYRHTPVFPLCGSSSEKFYKRLHSSRERRAVKNAIAHGDFDLLGAVQIRFDEWSTSRDGKINWWEMRGNKKAMSK
jgi:hypothetical protein